MYRPSLMERLRCRWILRLAPPGGQRPVRTPREQASSSFRNGNCQSDRPPGVERPESCQEIYRPARALPTPHQQTRHAGVQATPSRHDVCFNVACRRLTNTIRTTDKSILLDDDRVFGMPTPRLITFLGTPDPDGFVAASGLGRRLPRFLDARNERAAAGVAMRRRNAHSRARRSSMASSLEVMWRSTLLDDAKHSWAETRRRVGLTAPCSQSVRECGDPIHRCRLRRNVPAQDRPEATHSHWHGGTGPGISLLYADPADLQG